MTTRLPAWVAICAALAAGTPKVYAEDPPEAAPGTKPLVPGQPERRQVAVIDLSEDPSVGSLSGSIYQYVNNGPVRDVLTIPDKRTLDSELTGRMFDEDADHIANATESRKKAQSALDATNAAQARSDAQDGERELAQTVPTPETKLLYADLALLDGLGALEVGKTGEALAAFALTRRLDPSRSLDPAAFPPDVVAMFGKATSPKSVPFEVQGNGRVWIDFVERGPGPGTFDVEVGEHVIVVSGTERKTTAVMPTRERTAVTISSQVKVPDDLASDRVKVQRARLALSRAQAKGDDAARASAMKALAYLLGVHDAVLVSKRSDGKLQFETWRDRAPGFSAPQLYTGQKPAEILDPLVPPRPPQQIEKTNPPFTRLPPYRPPEEQQWYQTGWIQASIAGGVILAIVGGVMLASRDRRIDFGNGDVKSQ